MAVARTLCGGVSDFLRALGSDVEEPPWSVLAVSVPHTLSLAALQSSLHVHADDLRTHTLRR